jgi:hypothetical protein
MARDIARQLARRIPDGITADDVQQALAILGYELLGNAAGGIFRGREWVFTGRWRKSARVTNHGHQNRVWRLA